MAGSILKEGVPYVVWDSSFLFLEHAPFRRLFWLIYALGKNFRAASVQICTNLIVGTYFG
jgi:hypothetical protein